MAIAPASEETQERIKLETEPSPYKFKVSADYRFVVVKTARASKPFRVDVLEFMKDNSGLPEAVRDMAREALEELQRQKAKADPRDMIKISRRSRNDRKES